METKSARIPYPEDLPETIGKTPQEFEQELRFITAARLYELGRISSGRAADMAGVTRSELLNRLGEYQVSMFNYSEAELNNEIADARERAKQEASS